MAKASTSKNLNMEVSANDNGVFELSLSELAEAMGVDAESIKVKRPKRERTTDLNGDIVHDSKLLAKSILADIVSDIGRFRVFKNGKKTFDGTEYSIGVKTALLDYIGGQITATWKSVRTELETESKTDTGLDDIPWE